MDIFSYSSAAAGASYLYQHRDEIFKNLKKAMSWWHRPRSVPLLKVTGLLFASKSGKTSLASKLAGSTNVAFIDVDDMALRRLGAGTPDELAEMDFCSTIQALVNVKKRTFKHVVLIGTDHQRLKRCGAQRSYVCYASSRFIQRLEENGEIPTEYKKAFLLSHSLLSFIVNNFSKKRCFIYDTLDDIEQLVRIVYGVKEI